jgi:hypothetical protein
MPRKTQDIKLITVHSRPVLANRLALGRTPAVQAMQDIVLVLALALVLVQTRG